MDIAIFLSRPDQYQGPCLSDYHGCFGDSVANHTAAAYQSMTDRLISRGLTRLTHLYFGAEFCEYLIPSRKELEQYIQICKSDSLQPVFVTPVVTDHGIGRLQACFDFLDGENVDYAVVVNDLGVLQLLCARPHKPRIIAGRVLDKTSHDSRIPEKEMTQYYSAPGIHYASEPGILSEHSTRILSGLGVSRYEFDLPKTGLQLPDTGYPCSLYWPFHYLTTGRVCLFRSMGKTGAEKFLVGQDLCGGRCKAYELELRKPMNGYSFEHGIRKNNQYLFQKGNTLFYLYDDPNINDQLAQFDRIVLQML